MVRLLQLDVESQEALAGVVSRVRVGLRACAAKERNVLTSHALLDVVSGWVRVGLRASREGRRACTLETTGAGAERRHGSAWRRCHRRSRLQQNRAGQGGRCHISLWRSGSAAPSDATAVLHPPMQQPTGCAKPCCAHERTALLTEHTAVSAGSTSTCVGRRKTGGAPPGWGPRQCKEPLHCEKQQAPWFGSHPHTHTHTTHPPTHPPSRLPARPGRRQPNYDGAPSQKPTKSPAHAPAQPTHL